MNPSPVPTVRIMHEDFPDGIVINADEFDENEHVPFGSEPDDGEPDDKE